MSGSGTQRRRHKRDVARRKKRQAKAQAAFGFANAQLHVPKRFAVGLLDRIVNTAQFMRGMDKQRKRELVAAAAAAGVSAHDSDHPGDR